MTKKAVAVHTASDLRVQERSAVAAVLKAKARPGGTPDESKLAFLVSASIENNRLQPVVKTAKRLQNDAEGVHKRIRAARQIGIKMKHPHRTHSVHVEPTAPAADLGAPLPPRVLTDRLVLIGASTGGTEAVKEVLMRMPERSPGILVVQHMPEMFTASFAKRLDGLCHIRVKEAEDGEKILPGTAYIAPGHSHLLVKRVGGLWFCELQKGLPVNRHRPSVDVLFHSAAKHVGASGVGVMLTGMGKDGALGMLAMRNAGCYNICQDQESSVVWGMPREATLNGAAHETATLKDIAGKVVMRLRSMDGRVSEQGLR